MANLHDCLQRAADFGEVEKTRAAAAQNAFDQLVDRYAQAMPRHQAEATAAAHLKEATKRAARSRRHAVINQMQAQVRLRRLIEDADDPGRAVLALLESAGDDGFRGESVRWLADALSARARSDIREFLEKTGTGAWRRTKDRAMLLDVIRELHGQETKSSIAKGYAEAIRNVQGWQRRMFNAHGGDIGELADYGLRHSHDWRQIEKTGFDQWFDDLWQTLDWHRIEDFKTGQPFAEKGKLPSEPRAREFLEQVFENGRADGWHKREPSYAVGGQALYNRRAEPRVLHFRDADAWLAYNDKYGTSDPFTALVGGIDAMSRDIAQMRVLGPNPNLGLEYAIQVAEKKAKTSGDPKLRARTERRVKQARVLMHHVTGTINTPEHEGMARFFSNLRHWNTAARLGSAILSSASDLGTITIGAAVSGRNPANTLGKAVKLMASAATREDAARMGFTAETLMNIMSSSARLTNDVVAGDTFSRMSNFTIRASGLAYWTDKLRMAVQMDTAGHLGANAARALKDVDPMLRQILERNGITAWDWDALREVGALYEPRPGATFIAPSWWLEHQTTLPRLEAENLATRLQAALQDHTETLVPSRRLRGSAMVLGDTRPGTPIGELARSTAGFKNYAISITLGQIALYNSIQSPATKAAYLAGLAMVMPVLGMLSIQLKELAKGRDPRPMDNPKVWLAATAQGGGLGIFGDFLFSETNRFGGGLAQTLAGPVVGTISDVTRAGMSNVQRAAEGKDTMFGRDASNLLRHNMPVASSLWYTRRAWDALVADNVQRFLDPEAERLWLQQEKSHLNRTGNASYWKRGDALPERGPDFSNMIGDAR